MKQRDLTPPDFNRCQVEKPNGNSFMTFGGKPELIRCINEPTYILHEKIKQEDGLQGCMSCCIDCKNAFIIQMASKLGDYVICEIIK